MALAVLAASLSSLVGASELRTAEELLERSIAHHDPEARWGKAPLELHFEESRPDGTVREAEVLIDLERERFSWRSQRDGREVAGRLDGDACAVRVGGKTVPPEKADSLGLGCDAIERRRNYYTYLWGLPMKLRDPGTRIDDAVAATEFEGREVLALRVTYDEAVGGDTWIFYFDPETAALVGYRFFHDESANDGEYVTLEGESRVGGLRLPRTRAWFTNRDDGYLGTDTLVAATEPRFTPQGVLVSPRRPALALAVDQALTYAGRHSFVIGEVAAGERFVFVEAAEGEVTRLFIVQLEAFLPGVDDFYRYDLSRSPVVAGYSWRGNGFAFDLSDARAANPGGESSLTASFLEKRGWIPPDQWMMWRSLTVTDESRKSEAILFYVEDAADAGMTLDALYRDGEETPQWIELQAALERRASEAFTLTTLDGEGRPEASAWSRMPVAAQRPQR